MESLAVIPGPEKFGELTAPFGPGGYELRNRKSKELVLFGRSKNLAHRMYSLLPKPFGVLGRSNEKKKMYVFRNLNDIGYRTKASKSDKEAKQEERFLLARKHNYIFQT